MARPSPSATAPPGGGIAEADVAAALGSASRQRGSGGRAGRPGPPRPFRRWSTPPRQSSRQPPRRRWPPTSRSRSPGRTARSRSSIDAESIAGALSFGPLGSDVYAARIDPAAVAAALKARAKDVNRAPVNARIAVAASGGLGGVIPGADGRKLDVSGSSDEPAGRSARGEPAARPSVRWPSSSTSPSHR